MIPRQVSARDDDDGHRFKEPTRRESGEVVPRLLITLKQPGNASPAISLAACTLTALSGGVARELRGRKTSAFARARRKVERGHPFPKQPNTKVLHFDHGVFTLKSNTKASSTRGPPSFPFRAPGGSPRPSSRARVPSNSRRGWWGR